MGTRRVKVPVCGDPDPARSVDALSAAVLRVYCLNIADCPAGRRDTMLLRL